MYRHGAINDYGELTWDKRTITGFKFYKKAPINTDDTYFMIIGPEQEHYLQPVLNSIHDKNGTILYVSPKAINFGYDDVPRNTLIVFEFNAVQV
jgi:hypothetical protein